MDFTERRVKFAKGLHPLYLPLYNKLCAKLSPYWAPYSGLRTIEEQNHLYATGRTQDISKKTVTDAQGGFSPHNYGCATDWTLWDTGRNPMWMDKDDDRWSEYRDTVGKIGAMWGGDFMKVDCPHNELALQISWHKVGHLWEKSGVEAAMQLIETERRV